MAAFCVQDCGDDGAPLRLAFETEHFVVLTEKGVPDTCPVLGEWLEGYYQEFESYLGLRRATTRKLTYEIFNRTDAARSACNGAGVGCYVPESDTIVTVLMLHPHEIAHVFETLVGGPGNGPRLFSEGMATALSGVGAGYTRRDHRVDSSVPIEDLLEDEAFLAYASSHGQGDLYAAAAGFVRHLIDTLGKTRFLEFVGALDGRSGRAAVAQVYQAVVGDSFDDAIAAWRASAQPIVEDLQLVSAGCAISPLVNVGQSSTIDPACVQRGFTFDVPSTGRQDVVIQSANALVRLRSCDRGELIPGPGLLFVPARGDVRVAIDGPPGRYEGIVSEGLAEVAIPATTVTVDVDGTCSAPRIPAEIGGPTGAAFALVRRWGSVEQAVAFDVVGRTSGVLEIDSASGHGVASGDSAPRVFFLCGQACPSNPAADCARDDIFEITGGIDPLRDVFGTPVVPDQTLHFQTGPRSAQDWSYSVRVRVD